MKILPLLLAVAAAAQNVRPPLPAPLSVPKPGPVTDAPYAPQAILPGGIVVPLYPPGSPFLKAERVKEAEVYNMSQAVHGRISSIVNIHNPSIEVHLVERGINTGAAIILAAGGGHRTLNVGGEAADFVPFFYNYGVNALQAIRLVRAYAKEWNIDPKKIGIMGFSAGAELSAPAAVEFPEFDRNNKDEVSSRPDFVGIIYPGPSPFTRNRTAPAIPSNVPPAFIASAGPGDRVHAIWAIEYYSAMLEKAVPNIELHLYGNGRHPGDPLPDGSRMSGGLTDRNGIPFGTWQYRFIDWFRDLGFLQKPGIETKAAKDVADFVAKPPQIRPPGPKPASSAKP